MRVPRVRLSIRNWSALILQFALYFGVIVHAGRIRAGGDLYGFAGWFAIFVIPWFWRWSRERGRREAESPTIE